MINKYYQRELERLRELGAEFARAHPALAPMLSGEGADPDVERVLEGTAFLSGLIHEKLDDELPEIIYSLLQAVAPHYLRPIPATTLIRFTPKKSLRESLLVPRGTAINSTPVDGTECTFSTCRPVRLLPLRLTRCTLERQSKERGVLKLAFSLTDMLLEALPPDSLALHLAGSYAEASQRFMVLCTCLEEMILTPGEGGRPLRLGKESFIPGGFDAAAALLPYPSRSFSGFRHLQEYFTLPEQFCSFSVSGLERWTDRGTASSFVLEMHLKGLPDSCPEMQTDHFHLFVTPAVNVFPMAAEPITLDHRTASYLVRPSARNKSHYQVYSVDRVRGIPQGGTTVREYKNFLISNPSGGDTATYTLTPKVSVISDDVEQWLSVAYPPDEELKVEVLSLDLHCSNAGLTDRLRAGDVRVPTSTSPELADFASLRAPTAVVQPPLGSGTLWRLLSHLYVNLLSIADAERVKSILSLYVFSKTKDRAALAANRTRVGSIESMDVAASERFVRDSLMRGQRIRLTLKEESFAGLGDMYIFGSVLDVFFSNYAAINTYTQLSATDALRRIEYQWPARLGSRTLL